jgi:aminopeptidase N
MALTASVLGACSGHGTAASHGTAPVGVPTTAPTTSSSTTTTTVPPTPGARDVGDALTPGEGNGGYDVAHYDLRFEATDPSGSLTATTTITAAVTQSLSRFDLDLSGFTVDSVRVDDADATFVRDGDELVVTPPQPLADGRSFTTVVRYHGVPASVHDPTAPGRIGWLRGEAGTYVANEPVGARGVFPSNDHPSDKADYTITVVAPSDRAVVANGVEVATRTDGATTTHTFETRAPMATYLLQIAIGAYRVQTGTGPAGLPMRSAAPARTDIDLAAINAQTANQLAYFSLLFGPYPFADAGVLIADAPPDFALETQTMPIFPTSWFEGAGPADPGTVTAHELAHQWFGDDVTIERWSDIWLNEGFATYAQWLWDDHVGVEPMAQSVADAYAMTPRLRRAFGAVTSPSAPNLFSQNEYDGAAIVLAALRATVGDDAFFRILRTWVVRHGGANATTDDFVHLADEESGRDLTSFFDQWLRSTTVPPLPH